MHQLLPEKFEHGVRYYEFQREKSAAGYWSAFFASSYNERALGV